MDEDIKKSTHLSYAMKTGSTHVKIDATFSLLDHLLAT